MTDTIIGISNKPVPPAQSPAEPLPEPPNCANEADEGFTEYLARHPLALIYSILTGCRANGCVPDSIDIETQTVPSDSIIDVPTDDADKDGYMIDDGDCDDNDAEVNPGMDEICDDLKDNNCDSSDNGTCRLTGSVSLADADAKLVGEDEYDWAGQAVSCAGDVNADGREDLFVGAYLADSSYIVYGPVSGTHDLSKADVKIIGEYPDSFGYALAEGKDVDGDGNVDLLAGAYFMRTYLFKGPLNKGEVLASSADAIFSGEAFDSGNSVSLLDDTNNDGLADLLIGIPEICFGNNCDQDGAGTAALFLGDVNGQLDVDDADALFAGEVIGDRAGRAVGGGDLNGDGNSDMLVGAPYRPAVYVINGPVAGNLGMAEADTIVQSEGANFGTALDGNGDVNDDGYDDMLVAYTGQFHGGNGAALLYLGPLSTGEVSWSTANVVLIADYFGYDSGLAVSLSGNSDGDAYDDILIGNASSETLAGGAAYLFYGPVSGTKELSEADLTLAGERADDGAGRSTAFCDADGNGYDDLLIGAATEDTGGYLAGAAYLVLGHGF